MGATGNLMDSEIDIADLSAEEIATRGGTRCGEIAEDHFSGILTSVTLSGFKTSYHSYPLSNQSVLTTTYLISKTSTNRTAKHDKRWYFAHRIIYQGCEISSQPNARA